MRTNATRSTKTRASLIGICAAAVAAIALPLAPMSASAAPTPHTTTGTSTAATTTATKSGPTSIAYVEVNNDQLANVGRYTLANGANAFDVAIIFAANINYDGSKAQLYFNDNVQKTLDDAATQIRPLQAKGIKVSLSILGNHQGAGFANFTSQAAAADFATQVSNAVTKYGLDGVDLDDEYAEYGNNGTAQPNANSAGWLVSALRADMPNKLISLYNIGETGSSLSAGSSTVGSKIDYAWNPYYGSYQAPSIPGLTKQHLSPAAVDIQNTSSTTAASLAKRTVSDGYGVFMTYNLPGGDKSAYVSSFTKPLYGQAATYK
ncbi:endo-beta-N-acetylglucosaminidase H [Curtobacterium sp. Leaf261]|uniref:endo-beta-N-acetylglucosaminidase H n=1 Tax=Curtobacterium sp. Leaf261 TaxID=1736311 RepID=UPI0006F6871E|nr:endo-beta-N-acetylglucosaminidase H [Curtobacterium sp. Leaf261]KQO59742.1 chitinase [Curtobacterium sp. Leaf261]